MQAESTCPPETSPARGVSQSPGVQRVAASEAVKEVAWEEGEGRQIQGRDIARSLAPVGPSVRAWSWQSYD